MSEAENISHLDVARPYLIAAEQLTQASESPTPLSDEQSRDLMTKLVNTYFPAVDDAAWATENRLGEKGGEIRRQYFKLRTQPEHDQEEVKRLDAEANQSYSGRDAIAKAREAYSRLVKKKVDIQLAQEKRERREGFGSLGELKLSEQDPSAYNKEITEALVALGLTAYKVSPATFTEVCRNKFNEQAQRARKEIIHRPQTPRPGM